MIWSFVEDVYCDNADESEQLSLFNDVINLG